MSSAALQDGSLAVPVIDITSFRMPYADAAARSQVVCRVDEAARTVGFMQVIGHGIQTATVQTFTSATDAFFALDMETKQRYRCPAGLRRGYTPPVTGPDVFEAINVDATDAGFPGLPGLEAAVTTWYEAARWVARAMVRIFGVALGGREDYFAAADGHPAGMLRMNNYRLPAPGAALAPGQLGMGAHTDDGMVTVMWADRVPGLEIHGADGRWHPVMPAAGALVVNVGDALARLTSGEWISALHRVAVPRVGGAAVPRRSAAYFHDGGVDAVREPARLSLA